jgi:DNA-binding transcriptional MerR regulator
MKVSELSQRSGVPLPTIKFYIREGLLPAGQRTSRNQADYTEEHLERLALIRALREDAELSVAAIARALKAADTAKDEPVQAGIDALQRSFGPAIDEHGAAFKDAHAEVLRMAGARGWPVRAGDNSVRDAARALVLIWRSFPNERQLDGYLELADTLASHEVPAGWQRAEAPNAALRYAMLGTMLLEPFLLAVRRMAHTAHVRRQDAANTTPAKGKAASGRAQTPAKRKPKR